MRWVTWPCIAGLVCLGGAYAFQQHTPQPWREYPGVEYNNFPIPPDSQERTEWAFARLMYPPAIGVHGRYGWGRRRNSDWREGLSSWTTDYPRSDRHFSQAIRRLTRLHVRSVEQSVNLDLDDEFDWPWLYAVEVGHRNLTDRQAREMREYLDRAASLCATISMATKSGAFSSPA
jgi:hypothetical protein